MPALPKFSDQEARSARRLVRQKYSRPDTYSITPDDAQILLASTKGNRIINEARVDLFAEQMAKGTFYLNGESMIIDTDYALRDGHHRLSAAIKSGATFQAVIIPGIPATTHDGLDVQLTMDEGQARTNGQAFDMNTVPNSSIAATVTKAIMSNGEDGFRPSSRRISSPDLFRFYRSETEVVQSVVSSTRKLTRAVKGMPTAATATFVYQASIRDYDVCAEFIRLFSDTATGGVINDGKNKLWGIAKEAAGTREETYRLLRFTYDAWRRGLRKVNTSTSKPLPAWNYEK